MRQAKVVALVVTVGVVVGPALPTASAPEIASPASLRVAAPVESVATAEPDAGGAGLAPVSSQRPVPDSGSTYTGPGSCSAVACHGSIKPVPGSGIRQDEYSIWIVRDRHARAFEVLSNPVSVRMARLLGLPRADTALQCLACHDLAPAPDLRARTFETGEGVSCESCHGPASGWLGPHTTLGATREQMVRLGMFETKDPVARAEICLSCHLGTEEKFVDHRMIAAGHPDLVFDLEAYSAAMPRHWQVEAEEAARAWGVGQVVQLREGLRRLTWRARGPVWPEYGELDCFACHHPLTRPEASWRQQQGYGDRRPGNAAWNTARVAVARHVLRLVDEEAAREVENEIGRVARLVAELQPDRAELVARATRAAELVDDIVRRMAARRFDRQTALQLLGAVAGDADRIAVEGPRAAEQAAMAVDSLLSAYPPADSGAGRSAVDALYKQLENPSAYQPAPFAAQLRRVQALAR